MPDRKRFEKHLKESERGQTVPKSTSIAPKIEQKLVLTSVEKTYLKVLEAPFYLLSQNYAAKEKLIAFESETYSISEDIHEKLIRLLPFIRLSDEDEEIAEYVIYNIDSKGILRVSSQEISEKFSISLEKAQEIIDLLYDFFSEEISQHSSNPGEYIIPDAQITAEKVEIRKIEVKDPIIAKAIAMREETLSKICELVRQANEYFLKGYRKYPQTLTMRYMAKFLGLHISTISRAVKNKCVGTPIGLLPLRLFFGRTINSELIKKEIKDLLKVDEKLTDKQLTLFLKSMGLNVSRRTVNKYRNILKTEK